MNLYMISEPFNLQYTEIAHLSSRVTGALRCSQCMQTYYCSADCQKKDWPAHSIVCGPIKQNASSSKTKKGVHPEEEVMWSSAADPVLPDCVSGNHSKRIETTISEAEESLHYANAAAKRVSLSVGDEFSGVVSHVLNPDTFFCQQMSSARQLGEVEAFLNEYCVKFPSNPSFHPAAGSVCCAQFTEDNRWYRATVTVYGSKGTVLVDYIDYGNYDFIPLTRLCPVIPELLDLPAQAIKCTSAGVKPCLGNWTSEGIYFMKRLVQDKVFTLIVDKEGSRSVVELVDASVTLVRNISSLLIEEGCAVEASRVASPAVRTDADPANGNEGETKCCCTEIRVQLKKHERILLFLLNKYGNPDGFAKMKNLLQH